MKVFLAFVLGVLLAGGVIWVMSDPEAQDEVQALGNEIEEGMSNAKREVQDAVDDIDTEEIKENMKEAGQKVVDTTKKVVADSTITASVKTKLAASEEVSALSIDVDTTDGLVTLSGTVDSVAAEQTAVAIASAVEGVKQVVSTLQVKVKTKSEPESSSSTTS